MQTCHSVFSKFEKAVILSKMIVFLFKNASVQMHIFNISATVVQSFRSV